MTKPDITDLERRTGALEDELKARDKRIEELRREIDDQRDGGADRG
jgi:hypothetical protein